MYNPEVLKLGHLMPSLEGQDFSPLKGYGGAQGFAATYQQPQEAASANDEW